MNLPNFSIIVPAFNQPVELRNCLSSLVRQNYPKDKFEVIVIDDGSHLSQEDIVKDFEKHLAINFLRQKNSGPATARNNGVAKATGKWIVFIDQDCVATKEWLENFSKKSVLLPDSMIGGAKKNGYNKNLYSITSQLLCEYIESYFNNSNNQTPFYTTNNLLVPKDSFVDLGGFNTKLPFAQEDREFGERWTKAGKNIVFAPEVIVYHYHYLTLSSFLKQHYNYGYGAYLFHNIRKEKNYKKIEFAGINFYLKLILEAFKQNLGWRSPIVAFLLIFSQVIYIWAYLIQKCKSIIVNKK